MSRLKHPSPASRPPEDPVELDRLHAELHARVADIQAVLDAKRAEGWTFTPRRPVDD